MVCQQIYSSSVSIAGVDFTVFGALLSLCLVASMAVLLVFLHNVYKQTYQVTIHLLSLLPSTAQT